MQELKPCPFCGCSLLDTSDGKSAFPSGVMDGCYWIARCGDPSCHAEVTGDTEDKAIIKWNTRHVS